MTTYTVQSIFRAKGGAELRRCATFNGEAKDARAALAEAHKAMAAICECNPRIESIGSTVKGSNGDEIGTTDWADELGCGTSSNGLLQEIDGRQLDGTTDATDKAMQGAIDLLPEKMRDELLEKAIERDREEQPFGDGIFNKGGEDGSKPSETFRALVEPSEGVIAPGQGAGSADDTRVLPGQPGAARGVDAGAGAGSPGVSQSPTVPSPTASARGHSTRYGGKDIIADMNRAMKDLGHAGREPESFNLNPAAWDALFEHMKAEGTLKNATELVGGRVLGLPIHKNLSPDAPPIQVTVSRGRRDKMNWATLSPAVDAMIGRRGIINPGVNISPKDAKEQADALVPPDFFARRYLGTPMTKEQTEVLRAFTGTKQYVSHRWPAVFIDKASNIDPAVFDQLNEAFAKDAKRRPFR